MAQPVARIGDPLSHGGVIVEGSGNVFANGIGVARVGDAAICAIHGPVVIVDGNPKLPVNGRDCARVGSACSCGAVITAGSPNVLSNG